MDLNTLREQIDSIDSELLPLFLKRMQVVEQVAEYKRINNLPIYHPEREQQILDKVRGKAAGPYSEKAVLLYATLMDLSKSSQTGLVFSENDLYRQIGTARTTIAPDAKVACQGVAGANSHIACKRLFDNPQVSYYEQFEDVFVAVEQGLCEYGILPIENSSKGSVTAVYDLMTRYKLSICRGIKLPIVHHLLTKKPVELSQIKEVYSHEQALGQCSDFFAANPQIAAKQFSNTAAAAQFVAQSEREDIAAIASEPCVKLYKLYNILPNLQNSDKNYTRFICIGKQLTITPDADKISISLKLPHVTGSLSKLVTRFALDNLNLTKIESRPLPDTDFEFLFYFDFNGNLHDEAVKKLICSLQNELEYFNFFGNYKEL